jgi:uncharacterized membrane protein YqgA involved in biofilm formation
MHPILRNVLAVIAGLLAGSLLNGLIINFSGSVILLPEESDTSTTEGMQAAILLYEPKHFLFPFLAHALGTLVGAFVAAKISPNYGFKLAMVVGLFYLAAGIYMVIILPSPLWFDILDLAVAYFPMAYLGWLLAKKKTA